MTTRTGIVAGFRGLEVECKSVRVAEELRSLHPILEEVFLDALRFAERLGWKPVVTCVFRTLAEDRAMKGSGVHCQKPHRALDLRTVDVDPRKVSDLEAYLDSRWIYDPTRPKLPLCYGSEPDERHGSGPHMHLQVHANTRRRA